VSACVGVLLRSSRITQTCNTSFDEILFFFDTKKRDRSDPDRNYDRIAGSAHLFADMRWGSANAVSISSPRNVRLQNFQQYFIISIQLKYWIFSSQEALCDAQKGPKSVCGRDSALDQDGKLTIILLSWLLGRGIPLPHYQISRRLRRLVLGAFGASFHWTLRNVFFCLRPCFRLLLSSSSSSSSSLFFWLWVWIAQG